MFENLRHRSVRTVLTAVAIGVQVTMVLTLVGVSRGILNETAQRSRSVGADVLIRAKGSSFIGFSPNFSDKFVPLLKKQPHVTLVSGTLVQAIGGINSVTGVDLDEFKALSGDFHYLDGGPLRDPDDVIVDEFYARENKVKVGQNLSLLNKPWKVVGIFESGRLARICVRLDRLQELLESAHKVTTVYVKIDDPAIAGTVAEDLRKLLPDHQVYSMEEVVSLISVDKVPMLKPFIRVIIGLGIFIGFLVVFLSMYTAVLERTREIGVLKALGASPAYILNILLRETALLALAGTILGVIFTYGSRWVIMTLVPTINQVIVPEWWPIAGLISLAGALVGAIYPALKAAQQDAIEALAYD